MHFSIPETEVRSSENGSTYVAYNIHVNGVLHCRVRYSQLLGLHEQIKKEYGNNVVPAFPPKKIFTLTPAEVEQRREQLEKYMQAVRQDPLLGASEMFNSFLRKAQQETQQIPTEEVQLEVHLSNSQKVKVNILTSDQTEDVLEAVASKLELPDELVGYFSLFLVQDGANGGCTFVRKLQEFELPYVSVTSLRNPDYHIILRKSYWDSAYDSDVMEDSVGLNLLYAQTVSDIERGWILANKDQHRQLKSLQEKGSKKEFIRLAQTLKYFGYIKFDPCITDFPEKGCHVIVSAGNNELNFHVKLPNNQMKEGSFKVTRMSYWDSAYDSDVMEDSVGLNLLYAQTVSDIERGWILANKDQHRQLKSLQEKGSKKEFIRLAQTLKYFGYIKFDPCITDFPEKGCHVIVSAGNNELNFHVKLPNNQMKEGSFKVTRMRCWRVTSSQVPMANGTANPCTSGKCEVKLELAFEYLMSKDRLQWVTITSPQAIMMSICLQSMVDELMVKKSGGSIKKMQKKRLNGSIHRSNSQQAVKSPPLLDSPDASREQVVKLSTKLSSVSLRGISASNSANDLSGSDFHGNYAFEGIGDDDL
ncbi:hypothetical protein PDJAM_G00096880 [Pangasius djambal]|uniref:Uncharacterized protein n=1 Tax=Pangasius djambal TaxID=1691987 RepID=A0ACC5Z8Q9_9TELE|nr:hypothetical protein [Pangasius djambal]